MKLQKLKDIKNKLFHRYVVYKEDYDYYSASTLFMNDIVCKNGLEGETLLSMAGKTGYVAACLPFFKRVIHCTMMPMEDKSAIKYLCGGGEFD